MLLVRRVATLAMSGALLLGAACSDDDDPTSPTEAQVVGSYRATTFRVTTPLGSENVLQSGGSLTATFKADNTVTGHLSVPSQSVNDDFAGRWKIEGNEVEIEEVPTDIFVEDVAFRVVGNTLVGDKMFSVARVQVVLAKQ